ncbi:MAG TPA: hypothetical protein VF077_13045 [Nitrospiraceae bacterium]
MSDGYSVFERMKQKRIDHERQVRELEKDEDDEKDTDEESTAAASEQDDASA